MKKIWEKIKLNHRINKCLETEQEIERKGFYLSLISLIISITALIVRLGFK